MIRLELIPAVVVLLQGTVRVPAPCQYAHKLAQMVGMHLHQLPSPELANVLWYL